MVQKIVKGKHIFARKAQPATEADKQVVTDLIDTLRANREICVGMAANMMSYDLGESGGFPTYIENKKINKQDMVVPADLELNVTELHKFLFNEEDYYPSPTVLKINEKIISDTGVTAKSTE